MGPHSLTVVLGGYDQVARKEMFERRHPDARFGTSGRMKSGSLPVGGVRRQVLADSLEKLLDALGALAEDEAERAAIEERFPPWAVSLSALGRWYADRREPLEVPGMRPYRPVLGADDAKALRAALAAFGA